MLDKNVPQPWQGQTTLVFALAAAAIGLGNLFRLPYLLGHHGGAPFFIAYLATVLCVSAPILVAEVMLGSNGRGSPLGAMRWASDQSGRPVYWSWLGLGQSLVALLVAAQLLILAVWMVNRAVVLNSGDLAAASAIDIAQNFTAMVAAPEALLVIGGGILVVVSALVALGPKYAVGIMGWLALPAMAVAMASLLDYSLENGDLKRAGEFLFARRYRDFDLSAAMAGIVSGTFTVGAGLGIGLGFGARTPRHLTLLRSVVAAVVLDVVFALALAVVIMPLLFATNTVPTEGMALVFVAIPYAFSNLPQGEVYGALFFGFTALSCTAAILALMEPLVMILRRDLGWSRWLASPAVAAGVTLLVGLLLLAPPGTRSLVASVTDVAIWTSLLLNLLRVVLI